MIERLSLPPRYRELVEELLREHVPDAEVWVYGSRINGRSHEGSDLDLVVRGPGLEPLGIAYGELTEAFRESNIPILVQTHDWARLPKKFHDAIEQDYVVVQQAAAASADWREIPLGDVAHIVMGQSPPGDRVSSDAALPLLNGPTEFGPHHPDPVQFTTDGRKRARSGDILFCVRGSTTGRMNWADREYAIGRGVAAIRHLKGRDLQPMLRGVIEHHLPDLLAQATGSTFPNVSAAQLAAIPYPDIGLDEQRAIARVLGALDDKIELNRRMSETLEEMARALFRSWFVDFEPVRAKMEGRWRPGESLPGRPAHLHPLFPDRLVPSELGDIPEDWQAGTLGDVVEQLRDNENPLKAPENTFSHFSIPAYDDGQVPKQELGKSIKSVKTLVEPGTVLLSKLNPEIERVWLPDVAPGEPAICSTEFLVLQARPPFHRGYVYCLARSAHFRQQLESLVTGTSKSHQRARANAVLALPTTMPEAPVIREFDRQASPALNRTIRYRREMAFLASLRDALLPRLVSGELRVEPSEEFRGVEPVRG